jgi:hypothetical protein
MTVKRAMRRVVEYLAHERADFQLSKPARHSGHIWNAVRVLADEVNRHRLEETKGRERRVEGPVQGY